MDKKIIQPFIDATIHVLETMAFTTPRAGEIDVWAPDKSVGEVASIVGLSNEDETIQGFILVAFSEASILQIVSGMFGEEMTAMNDEVREAAGEIANMISGQSRRGLSELGIKLQAALPTIVSGKHLVVESTEDKQFSMVRFHVDKGTFELGVCLEGLS